MLSWEFLLRAAAEPRAQGSGEPESKAGMTGAGAGPASVSAFPKSRDINLTSPRVSPHRVGRQPSSVITCSEALKPFSEAGSGGSRS